MMPRDGRPGSYLTTPSDEPRNQNRKRSDQTGLSVRWKTVSQVSELVVVDVVWAVAVT